MHVFYGCNILWLAFCYRYLYGRRKPKKMFQDKYPQINYQSWHSSQTSGATLEVSWLALVHLNLHWLILTKHVENLAQLNSFTGQLQGNACESIINHCVFLTIWLWDILTYSYSTLKLSLTVPLYRDKQHKPWLFMEPYAVIAWVPDAFTHMILEIDFSHGDMIWWSTKQAYLFFMSWLNIFMASEFIACYIWVGNSLYFQNDEQWMDINNIK